jgi:hypothetical protein
MAVQINKTLSIGSVPVPTGCMIKPIVHFPADELGRNENGQWDGTFIRKITYDLPIYPSKAAYQSLESPLTGVLIVPAAIEIELTPQMHTALMANGALALVWLRDKLNEELGENCCTLVDPYSI